MLAVIAATAPANPPVAHPGRPARRRRRAHPAGRAGAGRLAAGRARQLGYLPQSWRDAFACQVLDALLIARHPHRQGYWDSADDIASARAALAALDIGHLAARDIRTLSGGERRGRRVLADPGCAALAAG